MQLSWPGNYEAIRAKVGSVDLCSDPDAVCSDAKVAFETAIAFWTNNEQPWKASYSMLTSVTQVVMPADSATNADRVALYNEWLKAVGIGSVVTPTSMPAAKANSMRCGTSWADANSKCGTPCPKGTDAECGGAGSCFASLDATPCATVPTKPSTPSTPSLPAAATTAPVAASTPPFSPRTLDAAQRQLLVEKIAQLRKQAAELEATASQLEASIKPVLTGAQLLIALGIGE